MRFLKILVGTLLAILATLIVSLAVLVFCVVKYPEAVWSAIDKHLLPADLEVTWKTFKFNPTKENWRSWQIEWLIEDLAVTKGSPAISMGFDKIDMDFGLKVWTQERWFEFRSIEVLGRNEMSLALEKSADEDSTEELSPYQQLRTYLDYLSSASRLSSVDRMNIVVPKLVVSPAEGAQLNISASLSKPSEKNSHAVGLAIVVESETLQITLKGSLDSAKFESAEPFFVGDLGVRAKKVVAATPLALAFKDERLLIDGKATAQVNAGKKPILVQPSFQISIDEREMKVSAQTKVADIPGPIVELSKVEALVTLPFDNDRVWSDRPLTFKVWSPVQLYFVDDNMRPPLEKACSCKIPEKVLVTLVGVAYPGNILSEPNQREIALDAKINAESLTNKLFTADVGANLKIFHQGTNWFYEPAIDSEFVLHSFQGLRQYLDAKNIMIPAPLDVLDGTVRVSAHGPVVTKGERYEAQVKTVVDLGSKNQSVKIDTNIGVDLDNQLRGVDIYVRSMIRELRIELPPLDPILGLPPMTRDGRVVMKAPDTSKKPSRFKVRVFLDLKTAEAGSIRLLSKLADPYVPITLDINTASNSAATGSVRLEPFSISYLRRKINVERFNLTLADKEEVGLPVDGRFRIDQTDYKVFVIVGGTLESPNVQLSSEPYLPRNEIVSVLLYDRTSDQLVSADSETVGNFEAALADRAIGLFGLWAFASTPIKSFSYNAVTKVYSATVQLGEGLTAGVGTSWEQAAHLEVRKRVSRRWVLTASWSPNDSDEQIGKLVLQWEKRF